MAPTCILLYTDSLMTSWDAHLQDLIVSGFCSQKEKEHLINVLEMKAVLLALNAFLPRIIEEPSFS